MLFFFFKQKTAYEMRISDWSSDVSSSDLGISYAYENIQAQRCSRRRTAATAACPRLMSADIRRTIDAVWRIESAKLIASLARLVRDVGIAEELAQDALVVAPEQWPVSVVPDNPGAGLRTAAKRHRISLPERQSVG